MLRALLVLISMWISLLRVGNKQNVVCFHQYWDILLGLILSFRARFSTIHTLSENYLSRTCRHQAPKN